MSAPRTDIDKQKRRHRGPLIGLGLVAVFGVILILYWLFELFATAPENPGEREVPSLAPPGSEGPTIPAEPTPEPVPAPETVPGADPAPAPEPAN